MFDFFSWTNNNYVSNIINLWSCGLENTCVWPKKKKTQMDDKKKEKEDWVKFEKKRQVVSGY